MSDENDENEHGHHVPAFAFSIGPTPEQVERMQMEAQVTSHETRDFFDSLNEDQLKKLAGLFHQVVNTDGHAGTYYIGIITGFLDQKFERCLACGKKHAEELAKMSSDLDEAKEQHPSQQKDHPAEQSPEDRDALMKTYGVEPDDDGSEKVMCSNCNTWYLSLDDRMLAKPGKEGCSGCIQKEKWG